ncbi:MAG: DUF2075 domain-containing protein [Gammaproteobacteria bacterium]|nr:DUF2075 domain-containing protein [Gammaproteobacteria bacterium]
MIVYEALRSDFADDVRYNRIEDRILDAFERELGRSTGRSEIESWKNSMIYMNNALTGAGIPHDAGVAIEYRIPQSSKRIDFILTGLDEAGRDTAVIVELKQWSEANATEKDAVVETVVGRGMREFPHPSYQAWTYAALIRDFNESAHDGKIDLRPCAYLHNMEAGDPIKGAFYAEHLDRAPLFLRSDAEALERFLQRYIRKGDRRRILYQLERGKLRPSKSLADHLASLLGGNREFDLIDEQKLVYETCLAAGQQANAGDKQVIIVEGGPGTGKSVVAVNLLVALTQAGKVAQYVTRNAAPRAVYHSKLTGTLSQTHVKNLFKSSGSYVEAEPDSLDVLVVDEAHRLNEKSGLYGNLGDHQVAEIIRAAKTSIFFIDDDQRVTLKDIGEKSLLREIAADEGATITEMALTSQFRCNGADGYLAWVDRTLGILPTANTTLDGIDYEFDVFDSPNALRDRIVELNHTNNKSRLVAGYCWDWKGKKDPSIKDVVIEPYGFEARWNLDKDGGLWILMSDSVNEVGCIHTCQGLELDYVGVIIGPDLIVRNGEIVTDASKRSSQDRSIRGYKKWLKEDPEPARRAVDTIIKNTYRTLMTRGQKGCYVFSTDPETNEYFKTAAGKTEMLDMVAEPSPDAYRDT